MVISTKKPDKSKKKQYAFLKNVFQRTKLAINFVNIAILIYGLCVTADNVSHFSIISLALTAIGWILSVLLEIIVTAIEKRFEFLMEAFQADVNPIKNAVTKTGNFFKKLTGQETIEIPIPTPSKSRILLDKMVEEYREEKAIAKEEKKQAKKEARLERIEAKKEARAQARALRKTKGEVAVTTDTQGKDK